MPTGVAFWRQLCSIEVSWETVEDTLLRSEPNVLISALAISMAKICCIEGENTMTEKFRFWRQILVGLLATLLIFTSTASAGDLVGSELVITEQNEREVSAAIAYNDERQEYLVVWSNDRSGNDDIRAQRVSRDGSLLGNSFYISAGAGAERRYPDVAYNTQHDQYLVVWENEDTASMVPGFGISARRVSGAGEVLDTADIEIRGPGGNTWTAIQPAVGYSSTSDNYMVIWSETWHPMPITTGIYGQAVLEDGSFYGVPFAVSELTGGIAMEEPDLAYNHHGNEFLVVWQQAAGALWDIWSRLIGGDGLIPSKTPQLIAYVSAASTSPAVAANPNSPSLDYLYLVTWEEHYAPNDTDINIRIVAEDGTPNPITTKVAGSGDDETSPTVACNPLSGRYLVTWSSSQGVIDKPIYVQELYYSGTIVGNPIELSGPAADQSAVARGPAGDFLIAWQDQPVWATNQNIYGWLWGNRVYLPLVFKGND